MKVKGTLPKGDADGLSSIEATALKSPKTPIVAIVILEPQHVDQDLETGNKELRVGIRRIEALLADDVEAATRLLQRSFESRTGESTLPIELENDIRDALKGTATYVPETQPAAETLEVPEGGYEAMTVTKLTALLKQRGLDHSKGTKTELVGRLRWADEQATEAPSNVTSLFNDGTVPPAPTDDEAAWADAAPKVEDVPEGGFTADPEEEPTDD